MRSHLAWAVIAALSGAACTHSLQASHAPACRATRAAGATSGIGIIGMSLDQHPSTRGTPELVVDRVVPDGPAAEAGIHPGDRILSIEGAPTASMSIADAARRLRGPVDASVALVIATGGRSRDVTIMRVAPSDLWSRTGTPPPSGGPAERVRASDVAPASQLTAPPCRH